jgi:hypothetical protein
LKYLNYSNLIENILLCIPSIAVRRNKSIHTLKEVLTAKEGKSSSKKSLL